MSVMKSAPWSWFFFLKIVLLLGSLQSSAQTKAPKPFEQYLEPNKDYQAESVDISFPKEIEKYQKLFAASEEKNPAWYREFIKGSKPGVPVPFHVNLNVTPEQYQDYLDLWNKREFKVLEKVMVRLEKVSDRWRFLTTGQGARIPFLRYNEESDTFQSTNGTLARIDDIEAAPETILGAWKGSEWRFEEETPLGLTKENFAVGKSGDGNYAFLVYRLRDITAAGTPLLDQSRVIRIPLMDL